MPTYFAILLILPLPLLGEVLTLQSGHNFSGKILSLTEKGIVIETPRSPQPLHFKPDSYQAIRFRENDETAADLDLEITIQRLTLSNGDTLLGKLDSLDEETLSFKNILGENLLKIPRHSIRSLHFGPVPEAFLYDGPAPLNQWQGNRSSGWNFADVAEGKKQWLAITQPGAIKQDISLPAQFTLSFKTRWLERPNLRIYFCDELAPTGKTDRYYVDINHSGLQLKRERSVAPHWEAFLTIPYTHASFTDKELEIELKLDRDSGLLEFHLDGQLIEKVIDASARTSGTGISIIRNQGELTPIYLSSLQVLRWIKPEDELNLDQKKITQDRLIQHNGKTSSGKLLSLTKKELQIKSPSDEDSHSPPESSLITEFLFQGEEDNKAISIPASQVGALWFKKNLQAEVQTEEPLLAPQYRVSLIDTGVLTGSKISLLQDQFTLEHSLLGTLPIQASAILSVQALNHSTLAE